MYNPESENFREIPISINTIQTVDYSGLAGVKKVREDAPLTIPDELKKTNFWEIISNFPEENYANQLNNNDPSSQSKFFKTFGGLKKWIYNNGYFTPSPDWLSQEQGFGYVYSHSKTVPLLKRTHSIPISNTEHASIFFPFLDISGEIENNMLLDIIQKWFKKEVIKNPREFMTDSKINKEFSSAAYFFTDPEDPIRIFQQQILHCDNEKIQLKSASFITETIPKKALDIARTPSGYLFKEYPHMSTDQL